MWYYPDRRCKAVGCRQKPWACGEAPALMSNHHTGVAEIGSAAVTPTRTRNGDDDNGVDDMIAEAPQFFLFFFVATFSVLSLAPPFLFWKQVRF